MWSRTRPAERKPRRSPVRFAMELLEDRTLPGAFTAGDLAVLVAASESAKNTTATVAELDPTAASQNPSNVIAIPSTDGSALQFDGASKNTGYLSHTNDGSLLTFTGANSTSTSDVATLAPRGVGALDVSGNYALQTTYTGNPGTTGMQTRSATSLNNTTWFIADQGGLYTNGATAPDPAGNFRATKSFGGTVYVGTQSTIATNIQVSTVSAATGGTITGLPGLTNNANLQDFYLIRSGDHGGTFDVLYVVTNANSTTSGTITKYSLTDTDSDSVLDTWTANGSYSTSFGGFGLAAADNGDGALLYVTTGDGSLTANSVVRLADTAGYNAAISINTADNVTLYTAATGATVKGIDFVPRPPNSAPVLSGANNFANIDEDDTTNAGMPVSELITGKVTDADSGALSGIAVTAVDDTNGTWQYSTNGGANWTDVGTVGNTSALLLPSNGNTSRLRFVPDPDFSGLVSPGVTFRAWDQTSGTAGTKADVSTNGGTTAFSAATAGSDIRVNFVDDPPVLALSGGATSYTENGGPVVIDPAATFTDVDNGIFDRGSLTVDFASGGTADDRLAIRNEGTGPGQIGVSGSAVTYEGTIIGIFNGGAGTTQLVVSLNGSSATRTVEALLRNVTFANVSDDAATADRTVRFVLDDGLGGVSAPATKTVTLTAVNDPPTLTATPMNPTYAEGDPAVALFSSASVSAVESGQNVSQLTLTVGVIDGAAEQLIIDGSTFSLTDGTSGTTATSGLSVSVSVTGSAATVTIGKSVGISPATAEAVVNGLAYLNTSLNPTGGTRTVTLAAITDDGGTASGGQDTTSLSVASTVTVVTANTAPVNAVPGTQSTDEDTPLVFSTANNNALSVSDADAGTAAIQVTLTATSGTVTLGRTTGLTITGGADGTAAVTVTGPVSAINAALDGLTFTPDADLNGTASLRIDADDQGNTGSGGALSDSDSVGITVNAVDDAPTFTLASTSVTVGEDGGGFGQSGFATGIAPGPATATDEAGQTLGFTVANDNNGLFSARPAIDPATGTLTFTPAANARGSATVTVTLADGGPNTPPDQNSLTRTFTITVNPVADTPTATGAATNEDTPTTGGLVITRNAADGAEVTHFRVTGITGGALFLADGTTAVHEGDFVAFGAGATQLRFIPAADRNDATGTFGFSVQASTSASAAGLGGNVVPVTVHVNPVNDPPAFALAQAAVTVARDGGPAALADFASFAPGGGPDEAGQTPVYTPTASDPSLFAVPPAIDAQGRLTFTPAAGASGSATVTVTAHDSGGADAGLARSFTITVLPAPAPAAEIIAVGSDAGTPGRVRVLDASTGAVLGEFVPFAGYSGGVAVAVADVTGDGVDDVIVATAGGAGHVKVFSASGAELMSFLAFPGFAGGLSLAAGDVDRDGRADIVVGTAIGSSHGKVFSGATGAEIRSFLAFDGFAGGVRVAAGDVNGDGRADVAVVAGPGGSGHVKVFDAGTDGLLASFRGYEGYIGEINLAMADVTGDGPAEVVTVAQNGARGAHVKAFTSQAELVRSFFAPTGTVTAVGFGRMEGEPVVTDRAPRVGAGDLTGDHVADLLLGSPPNAGASRLLVIDGATGAPLRDPFAFDPLFGFGVFVDG